MLLVIVLVVVGFILDYFLKQIFNIPKQEKSERKRTKRMDIMVKIVLFIIYIVTFVNFGMKDEDYYIMRLLLPFAFISTLYDSLSLWIYDRASKQWIRVLSQAVLWLILWISYLFI